MDITDEESLQNAIYRYLLDTAIDSKVNYGTFMKSAPVREMTRHYLSNTVSLVWRYTVFRLGQIGSCFIHAFIRSHQRKSTWPKSEIPFDSALMPCAMKDYSMLLMRSMTFTKWLDWMDFFAN